MPEIGNILLGGRERVAGLTRNPLGARSPSPSGGGTTITDEEWRRVIQEGGKVPVAAALRCRVRYFADGAVLGSEEFVQGIFEEFRSQFGAKRKSGPRRMKGSDWEGLTVLRDLRAVVLDPHRDAPQL